MSYASPPDVQKRIAPEILLQLAASPDALITDSSVMAVIQGWLDAASETVDGWIGSRYTTPVSAPPLSPASEYAKLVNWCADIACYNAYNFRGTEDSVNPWKARHDSITSKNDGILSKIAAGTANLPGCQLQVSIRIPRSPLTGFRSEIDHFPPPPNFGSGRFWGTD
jgi:phage gp36-like protein